MSRERRPGATITEVRFSAHGIPVRFEREDPRSSTLAIDAIMDGADSLLPNLARLGYDVTVGPTGTLLLHKRSGALSIYGAGVKRWEVERDILDELERLGGAD